MRKALIVLGLSLLACSGALTSSEPAPPLPPVAPPPAPVAFIPPPGPCCSVDDVVRLHGAGVDKQVIIDTIETSGRTVALTANDILKLTGAGVDPTVIDVLGGGPCVCQTPPPQIAAARVPAPAPVAVGATPSPAPAAAPVAPPKPPPLNVTVKYGGGNSFELVNLSTTEYTGLKLVANGEYQYRLKKLPANSEDSIRLSSFVSTRDGRELRPPMTSLIVTSDQGAWSKSF